MPLLAAFLGSIGTGIYALLVSLFGAKIAARLAAVLTLATIYISCVAFFMTLIEPWLAGLFSSTYGQLLGLLFPPISGTVVAGLGTYWTCVIGVKYVSSLTKMAVG
ncbi:hypothetical protein [Stenotrophomonas sp. YIM B06876]|uniref:hypothetical protein n=1 Tax=Stenotrophomonas sp. YIM B06876 TaxID=3060211 RepID=UPI0027395CDC|nr:hypothetical protein [Stenotrophomonas sp. YIM B06876]